MRPSPEQLAPEVVVARPAETRTPRLKQRGYVRRSRRSVAAPLVLGVVLCFTGLVVSCGVDEDTTLQTVGHIGPDSGSLNDDGGGNSDSGASSLRQTDDPSEDSGPVELVRVPDVIGLSSDEAFSQLDAAGFAVGYGLHDVPTPGVEHDTVTGADISPGTLVPFGSKIILDVYIDNQPDTSPIDPDEFRRRQISQEIDAEFGDRFAWGHWDETTRTYPVRIVRLTVDEAHRLQSRYDNEAFAVSVSSVPISYAELRSLKDSTFDLLDLLDDCFGPGSVRSSGVDLVDWSVSVAYQLIPDEGQSIDECVNEMKRAILTRATEFANEHEILADAADLVRFTSTTELGPDGPLFD